MVGPPWLCQFKSFLASVNFKSLQVFVASWWFSSTYLIIAVVVSWTTHHLFSSVLGLILMTNFEIVREGFSRNSWCWYGSCNYCNLFDLLHRREKLARTISLFVFYDPNHVIHLLLPKLSQRSSRIISPTIKPPVERMILIFSVCVIYNRLCDSWHFLVIIVWRK